jgi:RNA polymerase sigma factor (sigma-70 family)
MNRPGRRREAEELGASRDYVITPAWLQTQGIVGNEEQFGRQFLPMVQEWARIEIRKDGALSRVDPDELAQQVMVKMLERFRTQPFSSKIGDGGFHAYLRQCVKHAALDALRAAEAFYRGIRLDTRQWEAVGERTNSLADRFDTAWAKNVALLRDAVERVRQRVGAVRWEAFYLSTVEGLTGSEVAARLCISPSQVYDAKYDIAGYLRQELTELGYTG